MPSMMTERTSGHSARGSPRRSLSAIQSMSPWAPVGQEARKLLLGLRDRVRARDPDDVEPVRPSDLGERRLDLRQVVQKSRSA